MSLNKVMLIGNVGRDPEVRYLEGTSQNGQGRKVATFTLATTERYRDRNGESRENTEWHNIVAWGQPADIAERFVRKGTQLYVEGRLRTRSWTDQSGAKRYTTEINVDNLQLLGRRDGAPSEGGGYAGQSQGGYVGQGQYQGPQPQGGGYAGQPQYQAPAAARQAAQAQPVPVQPSAAMPEDDPTDDLPF